MGQDVALLEIEVGDPEIGGMCNSAGEVAPPADARCPLVSHALARIPVLGDRGPRLRVRRLRRAPRVRVCRKGPEPVGVYERSRWYSRLFFTDDSGVGRLCVRFGQPLPVSEGAAPVRAGLAPGGTGPIPARGQGVGEAEVIRSDARGG